MPIAFYDDVVFPQSISLYAFKGKVMRKSRRWKSESGVESALAIWGSSLRSYDAGLVTRPVDQWEQISALFEVLGGPTIGCLLLDPLESKVTTKEGAFVPVPGVANTYAFQRRFIAAGHAVYKGIAKPKSATIYRKPTSGSPSVLASSNYTIDYLNGRVLITGGLSAGDVLGWAGVHYYPIHFDTDELDWETVDRSGKGLLVRGPSVPLMELRWPGMPYRAPDADLGFSMVTTPPGPPPPPPPPGGGPTIITLLDNEAVQASGDADDAIYYKLTVPADVTELYFAAGVFGAGSSGHVKIFVRFGSYATSSPGGYDFSSDTGTGYDEVFVENPGAGDWYVTVVGVTAFVDIVVIGYYYA